MSRPRIPYVAFAMTVVVACWHDESGPVRKRALVFDEVALDQGRVTKLALHPKDCPDTHITMTREQGRHPIDDACLAKLVAGAPVELAKIRVRQGCMPGTVFRTELAGCSLGEMTVTETKSGPSCASDVERN